jgi:hypothetical protein
VVINQSSVAVTNELGTTTVELYLPPNTTASKLKYLTENGVELSATVGSVTAGFSTTSLNVKAKDGGGTAINKVERYNVAISIDNLELRTGQSSTEVLVSVTDKKGGIVPNAPVVLAITNPALTGATLNVPSTQVTNEQGQLKFTVNQSNSKLDYRLNHNVDLSVLVDDGEFLPETQTISIPVTGTAVTMNADTTIIGAGTGTVKVTTVLRDGGNQPIANAKIDLLNTDKSVLATQTTNAQGSIVFSVPVASLSIDGDGQARLTAKAYATTQTVTQTFENELVLVTRDGEFVFSSLPTTETDINQNASVTVQVKAKTEAELTNKTIRLSSSLGLVDASEKLISNVQASGTGFVGEVTFAINSATPGIANLLATFNGDSIRAQTEFVSPVASKITLQASPIVVSPQNSSALIVRLTDANDAPVKNKRVQFTLLKDASSGMILSPEAVTNSNGEAVVNYIAGNTNTAADGVWVRATSGGLVKDVYLTVAARAISITVGNSNVISDSEYKTFYNMAVSADVRDNAGRPIANQEISLSLIPDRFYKGAFEFGRIRVPPYDEVGGNGVSVFTYKDVWYWVRSGQLANDGSVANDLDKKYDADGNVVVDNTTDDSGLYLPNDHYYTRPYECIPEDTNRNGFLDPGEDNNSNGKLDGLIGTTLLGADGSGKIIVKTDATGKIDFSIRYLKVYAQWHSIRIQGATTVQGSEPSVTLPISLPVAADDIDDAGKKNRPNMRSPYGSHTCLEND